jgi:hypothetical protein
MTGPNLLHAAPKGSYTIKGEGVTIYAYTNHCGKPAARCYGGRRSKPDWSFYFLSEMDRKKRIKETLEAYAELSARKAKEKKAKTEMVNPFMVGDILESSWGYDQTNVDFYEVVRVTKKSVELRELAKTTTETGFMSGSTVPVPGKYTGETFLRRVGAPYRNEDFADKSKYSVSVTSCAHASLWDGKPANCSWYA